jgi:two-component system phosphate regulon sensor histidine kinase PhoR
MGRNNTVHSRQCPGAQRLFLQPSVSPQKTNGPTGLAQAEFLPKNSKNTLCLDRGHQVHYPGFNVAVLWYLAGLVTGGILLWVEKRQHLRQQQNLLSLLQVNTWSMALNRVNQLVQTQPQQQRQLQSLGTNVGNLEHILQQAPIGYLQVDDENRLIWCNEEANRLLKMNQASIGTVAPPRLLIEVARSYELDALIDETRQKQIPCQQEWMLYRISPDPLHPKEEPTYPLKGLAIPLG